MPEVSPAEVKALRDRTGLPIMDCKRALVECEGDMDKAIEYLRKQGAKLQGARRDRETTAGRLAVYADLARGVGAMVELKCESAPVANSPEVVQFAKELAQQLALGSGAASPEELLAQPAPNKPGMTLGEQKDDMFNRMREVFNVTRLLRIDAPCGGYAHHDGSIAVLVEVRGGSPEVAKDIAMHVAARSPAVVRKEELDAAEIERERQILLEAARKEGKPENVIAKIIESRLKNFYAEKVLLEQPFVKDESLTVGKLAAANRLEVVRFVHWHLGKA